MLKKKVLVGLIFLASSTQVFAANTCTAPKPPTLPEHGSTISYDQLMGAADQVSIYSKANMAYKSCLDVIITKPGEHSREQWRAALKAYNQTAPVEVAVWESYQKLSEDWVIVNQAKKTQ